MEESIPVEVPDLFCFPPLAFASFVLFSRQQQSSFVSLWPPTIFGPPMREPRQLSPVYARFFFPAGHHTAVFLGPFLESILPAPVLSVVQKRVGGTLPRPSPLFPSP